MISLADLEPVSALPHLGLKGDANGRRMDARRRGSGPDRRYGEGRHCRRPPAHARRREPPRNATIAASRSRRSRRKALPGVRTCVACQSAARQGRRPFRDQPPRQQGQPAAGDAIDTIVSDANIVIPDDEQAHFITRSASVPDDIDHMGHVNNSVYLKWVQEAVVRYWEKVAPARSGRAPPVDRAQPRNQIPPADLPRRPGRRRRHRRAGRRRKGLLHHRHQARRGCAGRGEEPMVLPRRGDATAGPAGARHRREIPARSLVAGAARSRHFPSMTNSRIRVGIGGWDYRSVARHLLSARAGQGEAAEFRGRAADGDRDQRDLYRSQKPGDLRQLGQGGSRRLPVRGQGVALRVPTARCWPTARNRSSDFLGQGITELGDRLGPILWQFMATKKFDARRVRRLS